MNTDFQKRGVPGAIYPARLYYRTQMTADESQEKHRFLKNLCNSPLVTLVINFAKWSQVFERWKEKSWMHDEEDSSQSSQRKNHNSKKPLVLAKATQNNYGCHCEEALRRHLHRTASLAPHCVRCSAGVGAVQVSNLFEDWPGDCFGHNERGLAMTILYSLFSNLYSQIIRNFAKM